MRLADDIFVIIAIKLGLSHAHVCLTSFTDQFSVLESVKAAADVYSPLSGTVVEVNTVLEDEPEKINKDPYGEGERVY